MNSNANSVALLSHILAHVLKRSQSESKLLVCANNSVILRVHPTKRVAGSASLSPG